jgi:hypothetical protein
MEETHEPIGGMLIGGNPPPKQAKPGRVCSDPGCKTVLSIYNTGQDKCSPHKDVTVRVNSDTSVWNHPEIPIKARTKNTKGRGSR